MPRRIVVSYIVSGGLDDDAGFLSVVLIAPFDPADFACSREVKKAAVEAENGKVTAVGEGKRGADHARFRPSSLF